jgi:peptidoglycan/xylan/chitin deacetylase (PgdA/CDA1 family)
MTRMRSCLLICATVAAGVATAGAGAAQDGRAALQAACWAPLALAAKSGENIPVRRQRQQTVRPPDQSYHPDPPTIPGVIRSVVLPPGSKLIALTFDLCETAGEIAGYDGAIIDYLRAQHVKATLFAGGQWLLSHRTRAEQLISDPLLEIGTHGWVHRNTRLLGGAELEREIVAPALAFTALRAELVRAQCAVGHAAALTAIPERPKLFRFPFGACNPASLEAVAQAGFLAIQWTVATGDPSRGRSAQAIAETMLRRARPGSIIIAHANGRGYHTAEALTIAIPALKARGFTFVTVSELIAAGRPLTAETCYDARPGDTDKYDVLFGHPSQAAPKADHASPLSATHVPAAAPLPR